MKVIDAIWFTNIRGTVGIVIGEDEITGEKKAYIGVVEGNDVKEDIELIKSWGNPFPLETVERMKILMAGKEKRPNGWKRADEDKFNKLSIERKKKKEGK